MALEKGICKNFGECDLADNKEVQEAEKSNFVCEECGKPLYPVSGDGSKNGGGKTTPPDKKRKIIIGSLIALLLAGGGTAAFLAFSGNSDDSRNETEKEAIVAETSAEDQEKEEVVEKPSRAFVKEIASTEQMLTMKKGQIVQLNYTTNPVQHDEKIVFSSTDSTVATVSASGEVKALEPGSTSITIMADESGTMDVVSVTVEGKRTNSNPVAGANRSVNLGYGTYSGDLSGGKPDGQGQIRFTRTHQLPGGVTAEPGDVLKGVFMNGTISIGDLVKSNGEVIHVR